ncbi:MAG: alginate export family protein, partial [Planctomycetota bacterium]
SGDNDRLLSSSSTAGGNRPDTKDRAFNAFGFRDTGIALAPVISNIHIYTIGASFYPFENHRLFERLEVGSKAFFYHKDKSGGPISDMTANTSEQWIGWEWDVYANWRITSDLTFSLRYGAFQPGTAFENQECRQYLFTGVTFSF